MTKKDYELIARAMKHVKPDARSIGDAQWRADVAAITRALARDNSRFDEQRFLEACGAS